MGKLYLILIHLFIVIVFVKTDVFTRIKSKLGVEVIREEIPFDYYKKLTFHKRIDKNVAEGSIIFIGDSLMKGLAVSAIYPQSVNYGIGFDTTLGVLSRINEYKSIKQAKAVILAIGINDLRWRSNSEIIQNYRKIIEILNGTRIVISSILPIDEIVSHRIGQNKRIININKGLRKIDKENSKVYFLDMAKHLSDNNKQLRNEFHIGDGVHLNKLGNSVWIKQLKMKIKEILTTI